MRPSTHETEETTTENESATATTEDEIGTESANATREGIETGVIGKGVEVPVGLVYHNTIFGGRVLTDR